MIEQVTTVAERVDHDTMGRLIAYGGGGIIAASEQWLGIIPNATVGEWAAWLASIGVLIRVIFDIVKWIVAYFEKRAEKKAKANQE